MIQNELLRRNLDGINEFRKADNDWFCINLGYEGTGKSTLGIEVCSDVDPTFNVKRITFTAEEFQRAVYKSKMYNAIMPDEGAEAFFTGESMTREGRNITKTLTQIRYKRLFILVNIPDFFLLTPYIRAQRTRSALQAYLVKSGGKMHKGFFKFYSKSRCTQFRKDPITKRTIYPRENFRGKFKKIDENHEHYQLWKDYLKKKHRFGGSERNATVWKIKLKNEAQMRKSFTLAQIATMNGTSKNAVRKWMDRYNIWPKSAVFKDIFGQVRIKGTHYKKGMDKLYKIKQKARRGRPKKKVNK